MTREELELAEEINQLSNNFEENKDRVVEIARILTAKLKGKTEEKSDFNSESK